MFKSLCILGRQPVIGLAELESLYGADNVLPVSSSAALLNKEPVEVGFTWLGGTVKYCKVLTELNTINWHDIQQFLIEVIPEHANRLPNGKLNIGLSVYDLPVSPQKITATAMEVKKTLKKDRNVRIVPNKEPALNSAQVLHNKLTNKLGWELIFVKNGNKTIVAQTIAVQDIEAYSKRDQARPKRDPRVGMLPPKLAQIIINLASGEALPPNCGPANPIDKTILDSFCGTGVILQEALLMGYKVIGTDLESRMIDYSKENLKWLASGYQLTANSYQLEVADATSHKWTEKFDFLASEAYLGRPFTNAPSNDILNQTISEVSTITTKFLKNLADQIKPGFRLCVAVPTWPTNNGFKHLKTLDNLKELGYNRVSFKHASDKELIYHRPGQFVGRELVVLERT